MSDDRREIEEIKKEIAVLNVSLENLNKGISRFERILDKMDSYQEKITELDANFKLVNQKLDGSNIDAASRRRESENSVREIKQQMKEMDIGLNTKIVEKIEHVFQEIKEHRAEYKKTIEETISYIDKRDDEIIRKVSLVDGNMQDLEKRVKVLENWKWYVIGIGVTLASIVTLVWKQVFG